MFLTHPKKEQKQTADDSAVTQSTKSTTTEPAQSGGGGGDAEADDNKETNNTGDADGDGKSGDNEETDDVGAEAELGSEKESDDKEAGAGVRIEVDTAAVEAEADQAEAEQKAGGMASTDTPVTPTSPMSAREVAYVFDKDAPKIFIRGIQRGDFLIVNSSNAARYCSTTTVREDVENVQWRVELLESGNLIRLQNVATKGYLRICRFGAEVDAYGKGGQMSTFKLKMQSKKKGRAQLESQAFEGRFVGIDNDARLFSSQGEDVKACTLKFIVATTQ